MKIFTASVALYRALYPTPKINRRRNVKNREVPKFCSAEILYIKVATVSALQCYNYVHAGRRTCTGSSQR